MEYKLKRNGRGPLSVLADGKDVGVFDAKSGELRVQGVDPVATAKWLEAQGYERVNYIVQEVSAEEAEGAAKAAPVAPAVAVAPVAKAVAQGTQATEGTGGTQATQEGGTEAAGGSDAARESLPDAEEDGTLSASRDAELDRLAAENAALRGQLAEVEAKAKGVGAPDAVARLMKANEDLRNKFINIIRLLNEGIGAVPPPASAVLASPAPFRPLGSAAVGSVQAFRNPGANYAAAVMSTTPLTTPQAAS